MNMVDDFGTQHVRSIRSMPKLGHVYGLQWINPPVHQSSGRIYIDYFVPQHMNAQRGVIKMKTRVSMQQSNGRVRSACMLKQTEDPNREPISEVPLILFCFVWVLSTAISSLLRSLFFPASGYVIHKNGVFCSHEESTVYARHFSLLTSIKRAGLLI